MTKPTTMKLTIEDPRTLDDLSQWLLAVGFLGFQEWAKVKLGTEVRPDGTHSYASIESSVDDLPRQS